MGLFGLALTFQSPDALLNYFLDPSSMFELQAQSEGSLKGLFSTLLRPFLAFALVAWWSRVVDRNKDRKSVWRPVLAGAAAGIGIPVANLVFGFNRAAFVFPLFCLAAVYSAGVRRIQPVAVGAVLVGALPLLMAMSSYRALATPSAPADSKPPTSFA